MARNQPAPIEGPGKGRAKQRGRARNGQGTVRYQAARQRYEGRLMIDGKPQSVYAKTEAEVIAKLNNLRLRQAQGLDTSSSASKWTIAAWLDHWYSNVVAPEACEQRGLQLGDLLARWRAPGEHPRREPQPRAARRPGGCPPLRQQRQHAAAEPVGVPGRAISARPLATVDPGGVRRGRDDYRPALDARTHGGLARHVARRRRSPTDK